MKRVRESARLLRNTLADSLQEGAGINMRYRLYSKSVLGPKYEKMGLICQDSSRCFDNGEIQIVSTADGHGSKDCFRSAIGSELAITAALNMVYQYLEHDNLNQGNGLFSETGIHNFKYDFWQEWRRLVREHWDKCLKNNPKVGAEEPRYETVSEKYKSRYESDDEKVVEQYLYTAYGTTLIIAISIDSELLVLHIGDGTCVVIMSDGSFCCPVPIEDRNFMNMVVSLCEDNAYHNIRHAIINRNNTTSYPVAIFLSSDGLDDCYPVHDNDQYLYHLYTVILDNIISNGFDSTEEEISTSLLPGLTSGGSQDDITLCYMICENIEQIKEVYDKIKKKKKNQC